MFSGYKKINQTFWTIVLFLLFPVVSFAQTRSIEGHVYDNETKQPIPLATVIIKNTNFGVYTAEDGEFYINTALSNDTLLISYIGYYSDTVILSKQQSQKFTIYLKPQNFNLYEVVIKPREDPARVLMKKVIEHKKENDYHNIDGYKTRAYTKIELDLGNLVLDNMNAEDNVRKKNPYNVLIDHIDTLNDETNYLPFFFTETLSDLYFRESPKARKEVIVASRTSGINNASASQILGNYYEQYNIYNNYWFIINKNFIPPVTDSWNFFYKVELTDSAFIDNYWCYKIDFSPRQKQENVFEGYMWIADDDFAVKEVYMSLDSAANINYYKRAVFYQEYEKVDDKHWVLKQDKILGEFLPMQNSASVIVRKSTTYQSYAFAADIFDEVVKLRDDIVYTDSVINNDEQFWASIRPEALNTNETGVYELVDSLQNIKSFMTIVDLYNTLMYGYWNLGYVRIGPFANMVSNDEVEGLRLRLGARTGDLISKRMSLGGYLAYGIKDNAFKYGGDFNIVVNKKPWQQFKFSYENDLDVSSNEGVTFGEDNILSGFYRRRDTPQKILDHEKIRGHYEKDWIWGLSNSVTFTSVKMQPLFDIYYYNQHDSLVSDINNAELDFGLRFAYREKFLFDNYRRYSLGTNYPVINFHYKMGIPDIGSSDFKYTALEFSIDDYFLLGSFGATDYSIKAGKVYGNLPTLLLESPPGNETYFMNHGNFNLMNEYEFVMDTYAELFLTHSFHGFFLNKIPLIQKLKLREVATFKMVYGKLSADNTAANNYLKNVEPFYIGNTAPSPKPYMEAGIGVENIFKLIRVDAIWRLSYRNNPLAPNFGVRVGVSLDI